MPNDREHHPDVLAHLQSARAALLERHPVLRYEPLKADVFQLRAFNDINAAIESYIVVHQRAAG